MRDLRRGKNIEENASMSRTSDLRVPACGRAAALRIIAKATKRSLQKKFGLVRQRPNMSRSSQKSKSQWTQEQE